MDWQPIETAPRDGTWILAACDGTNYDSSAWVPDVVAFHKGLWYTTECDEGFSETKWKLAWWMPLLESKSKHQYPKIQIFN